MVTTTGQDRKTDADMIKNIFVKEAKDAGIEELKVTTCKGAKEALEAMKEEGYKVIITGSLYLVADIKRALQGAL
jgi:dihydrofolate synthase/folylpolyglutamate synthase